MWRFLVWVIVPLLWNQIFCGEWDSRDVDRRCWENTSVTDPVILGGTVRMFCDPCEMQKPGIHWMKEHGTWDKSNLKSVVMKTHKNEYTIGRFILNWDMSLTIKDVGPRDAGRYRCSRKKEIYSWHQVIVRDPAQFHVVDTRKKQKPYGPRAGAHTVWSDWGPCSHCDKPGTRERLGYCYNLMESPLQQYHNGIPCNFPSTKSKMWHILRTIFKVAMKDEKMIKSCSITCKEADKEERLRRVRPYFYPFNCMKEFEKNKHKMVPVYKGETIRLKCHHCKELYGGVQWYRATPGFKPVTFDWHDNDEENRVILNYDMSMEIRRAKPGDKATYLCMQGEEVYSKNELLVKDRPSELHVVDKTKGQKPYSNRKIVHTVWTEWGPCSTCGKPGTRVRMGFCFSKSNQVKGQKGSSNPLGVPCKSPLVLEIVWQSITSPMLDEKMIEACNFPCVETKAVNIFASDVQQYASARKEGQFNPWNRPPKKPETERVETKVVGYTGNDVDLLCPGASEYALTEWKNGSRMIKSEYADSSSNVTRGRVYIDPLEGNLHIANVSIWDEQVYHCYANGVMLATVRFVVLKRLVDIQALSGSFLQIGNVIALYSVIFVFVLLLKCLARCIQTGRIKRSRQS